jgi:hypothetical protein
MVRLLSVTLVLAAAIGSVSIGGQTADPDTKYFTSTGVVKTFSDSALTIEMNNGPMTFAIVPSTRFVGKGLATNLLWREPHVSNFMTIGDRVTVTFRMSADTPTAVQVRRIQGNGK